MAEYWAREEKVDAVRFDGENFQQVREVAGVDRFEAVDDEFSENEEDAALRESEHESWVSIYEGDYIIRTELGDVFSLNAEQFNKRYYRRPLQ